MFTLLLTLSSSAAIVGVPCYDDLDGDGYASDTAIMRSKAYAEQSGNVAASLMTDVCPPGQAPQKGDCDDTDARIHPFSPELADNKDNDCDGVADEPTFLWASQTHSWYHGSTWVRLPVKFNDPWTPYFSSTLGLRTRVKVQYRKASRTGGWEGMQVHDVSVTNSNPVEYLTFMGLTPGTVYEFRVTQVIVYDASKLKFTPIQIYTSDAASDHFFAMTTGGAHVEHARRHEVVTAALYEYGVRQLQNKVGYEGVANDGDQYVYTGQDGRNNWCTEFYNYNVSTEFYDPSTRNITGLASWFKSYGALDETSDHAESAQPGDWLWLDTAKTKGTGHSVMVLDVSVSGDDLATIGGNEGNRIGIAKRALSDSVVTDGGLGSLTSKMVP